MVRISNILSLIDENLQVELYGTEGHICTVTKRSRIPAGVFHRGVRKMYPVASDTLCLILNDPEKKVNK